MFQEKNLVIAKVMQTILNTQQLRDNENGRNMRINFLFRIIARAIRKEDVRVLDRIDRRITETIVQHPALFSIDDPEGIKAFADSLIPKESDTTVQRSAGEVWHIQPYYSPMADHEATGLEAKGQGKQ